MKKNRKSWIAQMCFGNQLHPYKEIMTSFTPEKLDWGARGASRVMQVSI